MVHEEFAVVEVEVLADVGVESLAVVVVAAHAAGLRRGLWIW